MSQNEPLVSIIMPAFNAERYIGAAISSVMHQDYTNWELLIVNDGSVDGTDSIIRSFNDIRIRYFNQENAGVSAARNAALNKMNGEFFCFLDADDIMTRQSISSRIDVFMRDPQVGIVDGTVIVTSDKINEELRVYKPLKSGRISSELALLSESVFCMPSAMIRREEDVAYTFDEKMTHSEDIWFFLNIHHQSRLLFTSVDTPILYYRRVGNTAMNNLDGLGKGYLQFYNHVKHKKILRIVGLITLKYKIGRIMFLSYMRTGDVSKAILYLRSVFVN